MNPPLKFRALGDRWTICLHDEGTLTDGEGAPALGLTDPARYVVDLAGGPLQGMQKTLFHELIHVADADLSEEQVLKLEAHLYAILADNPALRRWLFKEGR